MLKVKLFSVIPLFLTLFLIKRSYFSCTNNVQTLGYNSSVRNSDGPSYAYFPPGLDFLTSLEKRLYFIIKNYIAELGSEPEYFFIRYIADYEESSLLALNKWKMTQEKGIFEVHSNPLWSYRMIRRFVTDLPKIKNFLDSNADAEIMKTFQKTIPTSFAWPMDRDLNNSMDSLLNIHFVYDSNLTEFANGIIGKVVTTARLSAIHCFDISRYALRNKKFTLALEWLEIADSKRIAANRHPILDRVDASSISLLLKEIIKEHDSVWKEPKEADMYQYMHKMSSIYKWIPQKTILQQKYKNKGDSAPHPSYNDILAFSDLCKGDNLQSKKEKSELFCWYESKINPAWYINPQKMELHSKDPYIYQVHDFIGPELIKYLKKESIPLMKRAMVASSNDRNETNSDGKPGIHGIYSERRTNMYAWLREYQHEPKLPSLSQRIGYLTGLDTSYGKSRGRKSLQIAMYTSGGYFLPHIDPVQDIDSDHLWDGLATFMLYLNNVELGGSTVFTAVGVAVPPLKGSALFWFNLKHNGEKDFRTEHGGCPVLLGEKWVGNDWIFSHRNLFNRKCTLNKDE